MLETMWDSMSSSMQLAQEAMEKGDDDCAIGHSTAAVESFAQTIDNGKGVHISTCRRFYHLIYLSTVMNRVKASFTNTEVRYEFVPEGSDVGFALVVKVAR